MGRLRDDGHHRSAEVAPRSPCTLGPMRLAEFHRLVRAEFGDHVGSWMLASHVLSDFGATPQELMDRGEDLREIWWALCRDNDVPEERWLGPDEGEDSFPDRA